MRPSCTRRATLSTLIWLQMLFFATTGVALQIAVFIERLAHGVDPAPAEHDVDGFQRRDGREAGVDFVELDPDFVLLLVVAAEPTLEGAGVFELVNVVGVDLNGRHAVMRLAPVDFDAGGGDVLEAGEAAHGSVAGEFGLKQFQHLLDAAVAVSG